MKLLKAGPSYTWIYFKSGSSFSPSYLLGL